MHKVEQLQPNQLYGTICMPHFMKINCCIHPDTDVLVLFVHHKEQISAEEIYILLALTYSGPYHCDGHQNRMR